MRPAATAMRAWWWRSRSAAISTAPAPWTKPCMRSSRSRRSSASTISWARRRCRTCCISASPMPSWSRSGIVTTWTTCRSPWPRTLAYRAAAPSTKKWVQFEMWCRTTCCKSSPCWRWMRRPAATRTPCMPRSCASCAPCDPCGRKTSCAASSRVIATSRASSPIRPWRRSPPCACGSTTGAGPACRSTSVPASAWRSPAPR